MRTGIVVVWATCGVAVLGARAGCGAVAGRPDSLVREHGTDRRGEVQGARDYQGGRDLYRRAGRDDGRAELPHAGGVRHGAEGAFYQTWESNRSLRMENVGPSDVINPWLSNGRNNFRTVAEIAVSVPGRG